MSEGHRQARAVRLGVRRELAVVGSMSLAVLLVIGLGAAFASRQVAQQQALDDAERMTRRLADVVIAPLLPGYLAKDPRDTAELGRALRNRMSDGYLVEVVVWSADGEVLFSDRTEDIGRRPQPPPPEVRAAAAGQVTSDFEDDLPEPDQTGPPEPSAGPARFVEVYVPFQVAGRAPMAFEAYYDYQRVDQVARRLRGQTLPLVILPLLLLQLVQIPILLSLARRVRRHENDRARLLERALSASDRERIRFAADLHDGPIQDLAGVSYALGAVSAGVSDQHVALMARVQEALQRSIQSLRGLMTDLYPPDLGSETLAETVGALAGRLRATGVEVVEELAPVGPLAEETVDALYRVARESLANVAKHARARTVRVRLGPVEPSAPGDEPLVRLEVVDDGVGADPALLDQRAEGHLGLRLVADRVDALGGTLVVLATPGQGTTVRADVPARPAGGSAGG